MPIKRAKVLVLGAGGIIGQHLLISCPDGLDGIFTRRSATSAPWTAFDAEKDDVMQFLDTLRPDVIINLAGENRVDVVEASPEKYHAVNVRLPGILAQWASSNDSYLIQASSQGVFSGHAPTYSPDDAPDPLTQYGKQKALAESAALSISNSEVVRLTFVLGIRPFQDIGRRNPVEDMIEQRHQFQVNDKFFSPAFAKDCAEILWKRAINRKSDGQRVMHLGTPVRCTRYAIASDLKHLMPGHINQNIEPVSNDHFPGIAPRPDDTTWNAERCLYNSSYEDGLAGCISDWNKLNSPGK